MARTSDLIKNYPDQALLEEVRRAADIARGPVLTKADFAMHTGIPAEAVARRFGGWRVALERARLSYLLDPSDEMPVRDHRSRLSDEDLLEEVRRVAGLVDSPALTPVGFKKHSTVALNTLRKRFGGWRGMLKRAGVGHMSRGSAEAKARIAQARHSDDELLGELRRVAGLLEGKPVLTMSEFRRHSDLGVDWLKKRFGSWRLALERAGLSEMSYQKRANRVTYSDDDIVAELRRVAELVGKPVLIQLDFSKHSAIRCRTVFRRFGGWRAALESAGLAHLYSGKYAGPAHRYTDEQLLEEVRRVARLLEKRSITVTEFATHSSVGRQAVQARFGRWSAVLERAGLEQARRLPEPVRRC